MHIFVILLSKSLIDSITKFANFIFIDVIWVFALGFFRDLYELITYFEVLFLLLRLVSIISFLFNRFFIECRLFSMSSFLHLLFNWFNDRRSKIFKEWLNRIISDLTGYSCNKYDRRGPHIAVLIISIFNSIFYHLFIILPKLKLLHKAIQHFQTSNKYLRSFISFTYVC